MVFRLTYQSVILISKHNKHTYRKSCLERTNMVFNTCNVDSLLTFTKRDSSICVTCMRNA